MWKEILVMVGLVSSAPVEWEHGWKTDYVTATRMKSPTFGYAISFTFPKQPYDSDRAETFEFLSSNGCNVLEGGGYPGAPLFSICKGVTDKESANKFLVEFLPKLDDHMRHLR